MSLSGYYLGCPQWTLASIPRDGHGEKTTSALSAYSQLFNTVEGNTTFYQQPTPETVQRWAQQVPEHFRFCFKFPQNITHRAQLRHAAAEVDEFLQRMAPLQEKLGPFMLQLPASFSPDDLGVLTRFLQRLPTEFAYTVELRHKGFFAMDDTEQRLNTMLEQEQVGRVMFDSIALFKSNATDKATQDAQRKKPRLPVHPVVTSKYPLVRFVGGPNPQANKPYYERWADKLADWLEQGVEPYWFAHMPDNHFSPQLAEVFHKTLQARTDKSLGDLSLDRASLDRAGVETQEQIGLF